MFFKYFKFFFHSSILELLEHFVENDERDDLVKKKTIENEAIDLEPRYEVGKNTNNFCFRIFLMKKKMKMNKRV